MNPSSPIKARNVSKNLVFLWKTSQINSVHGAGGSSVIFGQDSTVSDQCSLGSFHRFSQRSGRGSTESGSRNKGWSGKKGGQRRMHDEERGRKESGNLVHLGEKEFYLS